MFEPDDEFFEVDERKGREGERRTDRPLGGRLYLAIMPDVGALRQLLSLWGMVAAGRRPAERIHAMAGRVRRRCATFDRGGRPTGFPKKRSHAGVMRSSTMRAICAASKWSCGIATAPAGVRETIV